MTVLEAIHLSHRYGSFQALATMDFSIREGEIVVIEGPNGSGKTTLMLCLSGLIHPTSGELKICGHDLFSDEPEAMRCLAFSPDVPRFYVEMTAWEHVQFVARAHGMGEEYEVRAEELMKEFGIWEARKLLPHHYSRGMSLKLGLVLALIRPLRVLLLDEPTSAMDHESKLQLIRHLSDLRGKGAGILLSTHDLTLKKGLADRVWQMKEGCLHGD